MSGLILIDRAMLDHHIVGIKNPLRFSAWAWMLAKARYKPGQYFHHGHEIDLEIGQFACARSYMAEKTGMTDKQVRTFLTALERAEMVTKAVHQKGQGISVISITKYEEYQDFSKYREMKGPAKGPVKGQGGAKVGPDSVTPEETPEETPEDKLKPRKPPVKSLVFDILSKVAGADAVNGFIEMRWNIKAPMTERSAKLIAGKLEGRMDADAILDLSTENNWKTVYPNSKQFNGGHNGNGTHNNGHKNGSARFDEAIQRSIDVGRIPSTSGEGIF